MESIQFNKINVITKMKPDSIDGCYQALFFQEESTMKIEKETIRCEAVFNEEHTHRYLWKRIWNEDKALAAVIMLNPCMADTIVTDTTTFLVVNNLAALERFGGMEIVNLYSKLTSKLNFRWNTDQELNEEENNRYIQQAAAECSEIIIAWGRADRSIQREEKRAREVLELLKPYREKISVISDGERKNLHPLTPAIRNQWKLESFDWTEYDQEKEKEKEEEDNV